MFLAKTHLVKYGTFPELKFCKRVFRVTCLFIYISHESIMALASISPDKREILERLFFDIENSPVAYLPANRVHAHTKEVFGPGFIRRRDVNLFERTLVQPAQILKDSRSTHKKTLSYFVHGPNLLWEADLVDLHKSKGQRGRYSFALTVIDIFSRRADAEPVYDKTGSKVTEAFPKIGERWGEFPARLQTDKGKEFFNCSFQHLMKTKKIGHFYASSKFKAAVVESFNRRFQNMLYLYRQGNRRKSVKNLIKLVIQNYNHLPHRYHGYRPVDVEGDLAVHILRDKLRERKAKLDRSTKFKKPYKFKISQTVRTTRLRKIFDKGYRGIFTEEIFVVAHRFRRKPHFDINLNRLKDLKNRSIENSIYYENKLLKVELPDKPPVICILKRDKKGRKEVSLKDFPADFSVWM